MTKADNDDGNNGKAVLSRRFAPMLADLEDLATELTQRQSQLARELAEVEDELERVEKVRSIMAGGSDNRSTPKGRGRSTSVRVRERTRTTHRVERILAWARERGGEFTGREVAEFLDVNVQSVGPILAGMVRRGEATFREDGHAHRFYTPADPAEQ
jgi:hypothetical protein